VIPIDKADRKLKKRRIFLRILGLVIAAAVVIEGGLMLGVYLTGAMPRALSKSDAIIVLGARVMEDGRLSTTLEYRMEKALEVYRGGYAGWIVTCGGQGANEPRPEADAMAEYLIARGVPDDRILRDTSSANTVENLQNAKALMEARGLSSAIVVTSDYHIERALWLARAEGIGPLAGAASLGQRYRRNRVRATFRETLSWMNHFTGGLLGRVSGLGDAGGGE